MGVYDPLTRYLKERADTSWNASFAEIERIISRTLPKSAREYRPWWANQRDGKHSQSKAWQDAGWETSEVNLARRSVRFERRQGHAGDESTPTTSPNGSDAPSELDCLFEKAAAITNEHDRAVLTKMALTVLINHETARYFASLGGTMADFKPAPRERPFA